MDHQQEVEVVGIVLAAVADQAEEAGLAAVQAQEDPAADPVRVDRRRQGIEPPGDPPTS